MKHYSYKNHSRKNGTFYFVLACILLVLLLYYRSTYHTTSTLPVDNNTPPTISHISDAGLDLETQNSTPPSHANSNTHNCNAPSDTPSSSTQDPTPQSQANSDTQDPASQSHAHSSAHNNTKSQTSAHQHVTPATLSASAHVTPVNPSANSITHAQSADQSSTTLATAVDIDIEHATASKKTAWQSGPKTARATHTAQTANTIDAQKNIAQPTLSHAQPPASTQKTVQIRNNITPKMLQYKHWTGKYTPTKFIVTANGVPLETDHVTPVPVTNNKLDLRFEYEFMNGKRTGDKTVPFDLKDDTIAIDLTFSWKEESRFIVDEVASSSM